MLVADPCPDTVESTCWLLRAWGYDVRTAATGPEALEVARVFQPDAVLMDIALPGLDGCEVARRLRRRVGFTDLLLVAVTGYAGEQHRRWAREAGFDRHLAKPVAPQTLQNLLATRHPVSGRR